VTIIEAMHDKRFFFPMLKGRREGWTWGAWEVFLKALFGLPFEESRELLTLRECSGLEVPPTERARECFVICGRRSGKSFISAVLAVYGAAFRDWREVLSPGEVGWIFVLAVDKAQAAIVKSYIKAILNGSPSFRKLIKGETKEQIELRNGVNIGVKTSSFRSVRGYTVLGAVLEELAFWRSEDSANPDRETLAALRPALATVRGSLLVGISTPYARSGVLWEVFRQFFGKPGGPLVWRAPSILMNPTLDKTTVERELEADPEAARAEWEAEFRADISAFIPAEIVEAVTVAGRFVLPRAEGVRYFAFADPSGGRADSFALAIAHRNTEGRAVLDLLHERRPPLSPDAVAREYSDILKGYGLAKVAGDRYAADWVAEAFKKNGILYEPADKTASEMFIELLPMITSGAVELLDQKRLRGQLVGLERRVRAGGKDLVAAYRGAHDDVANAAAGALVMAGAAIGRRPGRVYFAGERIGAESAVTPGPVAASPPLKRRRIFFVGSGAEPERNQDLEEKIRESLRRWKAPPEDI